MQQSRQQTNALHEGGVLDCVAYLALLEFALVEDDLDHVLDYLGAELAVERLV